MSLSYMADAVVDVASSQGAQWLRMMVPVNQIYTVVALALYSTISASAVLWILPLLAFYLLFLVLLVVTAQMLRGRKRLWDIWTVGGMLDKFTSIAFDAETASSLYSWNSLKPYATFFVALPLCVAALSIADDSWIPSPELMALSGLTAGACFYALHDRYDKLAIGSVFIDFLFTVLPGAVKQLPAIPIVHHLLWYTVGPGFALNLPIPGLQCWIGLPSAAFLIVPLIFVRMAAQRSWKGTYQILVPHLVCFFWWRLAVAFFCRSTWFGLTRALIGWFGLIVMLPVLIFIVIGYILYVLFCAMSLANIIKVVTTVGLLFGASAYAMWSRSGFSLGSFTLDGKSPLSRAFLILVLFLGSCVPFAVFFSGSPESSVYDNLLPWSTYSKYCNKQLGATPVTCAPYSGAPLSGTGEVIKIAIVNVGNPAEAFASFLPSFGASWLRCAYGTSYPQDCDSITDSPADRDDCHYNTKRGRLCHMRELDQYTYEITVSQPGLVTDENIRLVASDWFGEPAKFLRSGHQVSFQARIPEPLNAGLTLTLSSIQCTSCNDDSAVHRRQSAWRIVRYIGDALHSTWNFFFSPILLFA